MKLSRTWRILTMAVVSLFVLWLIYYAGVSVIYGGTLRKLRAQVKATGSSLSPADLAPEPVPWNDNASRWYQAAALVMHDKSPLRVGSHTGDSPDKPTQAFDLFCRAQPGDLTKLLAEKREYLDAYLDRNSEGLKLAHEGARHSQGWIGLDYFSGYSMMLPHIPQQRHLANLLSLEACTAAATGEGHKAIDSAWAVLRLRRAIEKEPILVSYLVGVANDAVATRTVQYVLSRIEANAGDLRMILVELQSVDPDSLRRALEMERVCGGMVFDSVRVNGARAPIWLLDGSRYLSTEQGLRAPALFDAWTRILNTLPPDEAYYLSFMNRLVADAAQPAALTLAEMRLWEERCSALKTDNPLWHSHPFSRLLLPPLGRCLLEAKRDIARHDVAACGIAAELYRLDHGGYPDSLDVLAGKYLPSVPLDTFSGKSLLFKSFPSGVLIYSVGANGADDGGMNDETRDGSALKSPADDIAWRVERKQPETKTP